MSKKYFIILIIGIILLLSVVILFNYFNDSISNTNMEKLEVILGDKFTLLEKYNNKYILDYRQADLNKDDVVDDILLIGDKEKVSDNFSNNMIVIVRNCKTGKIKEYSLKGIEGYRAHIEISDFMNDDIPQLLFTTDSGFKNKKKQFILIKYDNGKFKEIFNLDNNKGVVLTGEYINNYIAKIYIENLNKTIELDVKDKKSYYIKNKIYDSSNNIINKNASVKSKNIDNFEVYTFEDNTKGILTTQKVIGINRTDILDEIKTIWKIEKNKLIIVSIEGQRCGKIL